jgi:cytochrome c oxidase assembly factor CtaG
MSDVGLWLSLAASAGLYARAAARAPRWSWRRSAAWFAGLAVVGVALLSPLDAHAATSMRAHMAQHLLLVVIAAPLLVAGAPLALALRTGGAARGAARRLIGSRALGALLHPVVATALLSLALAVTHVPALYDAALDHPVLHAGEHLLYLATAALFWTVVLGVRPQRHRRSVLARFLALLAAMPPMALVGVALMTTSTPVYAHYGLGDQHGAGRLMWVGGTLPMGALALAVAAAGLLEEERRQLRRESYAAGGRP